MGELGILVVGHGTRKREGQLQLFRLAAQIQSLLPGTTLTHSFLELAEPTIEQGLAYLADRSVRKVLVVPILLFEAGHAKRDIPDAVQSNAGPRKLEVVGFTPPLSCHPKVLELSGRRLLQSLEKSGLTLEEAQRLGLGIAMVGRGGSDREAIREMLHLTELRRAQYESKWNKTGFMAIAKPNLNELLQGAMRKSLGCVVVQPHLLFEGAIMDEIRETVREFQGNDPKRRWIIADPLGECDELAKVFIELINTSTAKLQPPKSS